MNEYVLGILFSGGGTTAEAIIKAIKDNQFKHITIGCAISSDSSAKGIEKLENLGIPVYIINPKEFRTPEGKIDREAFGAKIISQFTTHSVNLVTQNGWIPLTPRNVIEKYSESIFNQHPGPVPEFGGKGMVGIVVHEAVLRFQKKIKRNFPTQVVAHRVTFALDEGAIVEKMLVEVYPNDTAESLQQRALAIEHQNQIKLLHDIDENILVDQPSIINLLASPDEIILLEEAKQEAIEKYR